MLSIVIPTRNRAVFLERLLSYYRHQNIQAPILIADSSTDAHAPDVIRVIDTASKQLTLELRTYPAAIGMTDKLGDALSCVRTKLVALGADDDFFTVRGLDSATAFLEDHPDFSVAHGQAVTFELHPGPVYGNRLMIANYQQRSVEHSTAAERLVDHLSQYATTWYSVHRTTDLRKNVAMTAEFEMEPVSFTELLPSCLSLIQGKAKKLTPLYAVRQVHPQRSIIYNVDTFDWITNPAWPISFSRFTQCLSRELSNQDNISLEEAREIVKQGFWSFLAQRLSGNWRKRYRKGTDLRLRAARKMPGLVRVWQHGKSLLPGARNQMLLPSLLRRTSPYHQDFMPIYRALQRT